jgi:hypothetical protein
VEAAGEVITSQVDLLWSVALAVLLAKIFLVGRFSVATAKLANKTLSWIFLIVGVVLQLSSMLFGYITYGAIVTMNRCSPASDASIDEWCIKNSINQGDSFSDAEFTSLLQFSSFALGLVILVLLCAFEWRTIAKAINRD